jgi:hypothetical protein
MGFFVYCVLRLVLYDKDFYAMLHALCSMLLYGHAVLGPSGLRGARTRFCFRFYG